MLGIIGKTAFRAEKVYAGIIFYVLWDVFLCCAKIFVRAATI